MSQPRATAKLAEPEAVKVPKHVLESLSSADIAELVRLWNDEGPGQRAKALAIADADRRNWEARK
jgi:hypothetical protein